MLLFLLRACWTGFLLRCPRCGRGRIARSWFATEERCGLCGLIYEPGEGDFLGAIAVAYGVTCLVVLPGVFVTLAYSGWSPLTQTLFWCAFGTAFLLLFYRNLKGIWLGILYTMRRGLGGA